MAKRMRSQVPPDGFRYLPEIFGVEREASYVNFLEELPWETVIFRGYEARRRVVHFGHRYDFEARGVSPGLPIPPLLLELRALVATLTDTDADEFIEVLATEYRAGATIGWHRDAPAFGATVLGVSLGSACRMRFRRPRTEGWDVWDGTLEPRSAYVISGAARSAWYHSIPPTPELRYSVTYRTVRERHRNSYA